MASVEWKPWIILALLVFVVFFFESQAVLQEQAIIINPEDGVTGEDFADAAVAWWNQQGDLAQNIVIYSVGGLAVLFVIFLMVKKGG